MQSAKCRVQSRGSGDRGQGTGDRGQGTGDSRNPKSQIPNRPRSATTLLEVLFAIMVAATGILGSIVVFTVALSQARKGKQADATAVGADAAVAMFDAQLMRRPDRWLYWDNANTQTQFLPLNFNQAVAGNAFFGQAFCIDPMGFAHNREEDVAFGGNNGQLWSGFPAVPLAAMTNSPNPPTARMLRLTLYNNDPTPGLTLAQMAQRPMSYLQADKAFRIEDELMFDRPSDNTLPAVQLFTKMTSGGNTVPGRRQEEGRLTWFATLVPKLDRRNSQLGEEYVLSIVVCLNRSGEATHVPGSGDPAEIHPWNEWTAKILGGSMGNAGGDFYANGIGGGEVRITTNDPAQNATFNAPQYLDLKHGSWVMLGRTIPGFSGSLQYFQWYRISDADETQPTGNRFYQDVTLIGPDWPVDLIDNNSGNAPPDGFADQCDVIIMPHVVHVYERTIKIDTGAVP